MALEIINISKKEYLEFSINFNNVFCSKEWLDIYSDKISFCKVSENNNLTMAVFYYYRDKKNIIDFFHSPSFTPYNGFLYNLISNNYANQKSDFKKILNSIAQYFDKLAKNKIIKIAFPPEIIDMQPFIWKNFKVIPNYTYKISLSQSLSIIESKMSKERRNDIKKATKDGIISIKCEDNKIVKQLIEKTFNRNELNINNELLDKILFQYSNNDNSFSFVSYQNEKPISAVFCIFDKTTAYYLLGGYDNKNKHSGAGALSLWNAIEHSKNLGLEVFDFEGSMLVPVEKYFRNFGGDIVPYFTINKANILLEIVLKFIKRENF